MDKTYSPTEIEKKWRETWESSGIYNATKIVDGQKNFTIILPPPNANASLHAGHAMFVVQDILVRYHRMRGDNAVWIPGTDHAGFETQYVFEKALSKQGKSRFDFNRQDFYKAVYEFVQDNSGLIEEQLKSLGFSLDWSRKSFTLDEHVVRLVYDTFEKMYVDGLIYRDNYIVNYCTHCGTTFSELEINYIDRVDPLYYIKYGPFVLATVRPETIFGDTAIAVNPNDARYKAYLGKEVEVEGLLGKFKMKVIADEFVDPEFGTGVVKVTPAHDPNDFTMGRRHGLEVRKVIDLDGRLNAHAGKFAGMHVKEARTRVVEALKESGLMERIDENYSHRVAVCYKCGRDIEPMVLPNWFVKMKPLAERAKLAAKNKYVQFYPARFEDEFFRWLDAIKDWPISRQVVWGIRIPVWYDVAKNPNLHVKFLNKDGEIVAGRIDELLREYDFEEISKGLQSLTAENDAMFVIADKCPQDGGMYLPETDTFDTWFSSGQWPLAVLHYPDGEDFMRLYPTTVLDTMWDILFFWVARMIMLGIYVTEKDGRDLADAVPFRQVLLHSRVVDAKGVKMSKSKGNVINPLDLTAKYGTDAFRMSLVAGSALGNDVPMAEEKVKGYRNFANKIWNSARFVMDFRPKEAKGIEMEERFYRYNIFDDNWMLVSRDLADFGKDQGIDQGEETRSVLEKLNELRILVEDTVQKYRFSDAALAIYEFYWHEFCDKYIEYAKNRRKQTQLILEFVLKSSMELLHPFMPFITEEIWQQLPHKGKSISIASR
jgi:valyl-tRNA synthetase